MTTEELRELDVWIANFMEPRPQPVTLRSIRGKNDGLYNFAEQNSKGGWWKCQTGTDAENRHIGDLTLCDWEPLPTASEQSTESTAAAMEVLKVCSKKVISHIRIWDYSIGKNISFGVDDGSADDDGICSESETHELAICLFAKKLFSK